MIFNVKLLEVTSNCKKPYRTFDCSVRLFVYMMLIYHRNIKNLYILR